MTPTQTATYKAALKEARAAFDSATKRLNELIEECGDLSREITRLRRTITALAALCSESPGLDDLGITDACMEVMEAKNYALSTADVVKALDEMGFDLDSQKNASASVHTVLSRLYIKNKIKKEKNDDGTIVWKGPNYDPNAARDDDIPF